MGLAELRTEVPPAALLDHIFAEFFQQLVSLNTIPVVGFNRVGVVDSSIQIQGDTANVEVIALPVEYFFSGDVKDLSIRRMRRAHDVVVAIERVRLE